MNTEIKKDDKGSKYTCSFKAIGTKAEIEELYECLQILQQKLHYQRLANNAR
jgi:hypothetical protein